MAARYMCDSWSDTGHCSQLSTFVRLVDTIMSVHILTVMQSDVINVDTAEHTIIGATTLGNAWDASLPTFLLGDRQAHGTTIVEL